MKLSDKLEPVDLIAIILVIGCLSVSAFGIDGIFKQIPVYVAIYYFGKKSNIKN